MQGGRSTPSFALHFGLLGEGGGGEITLDSAGSRPVSGRRSKSCGNRPRTKRPTSFSANYPYMGCGMGQVFSGCEESQSGAERKSKGAAGCREECLWPSGIREGISKLSTEKFHLLRRGGWRVD